MKKIYSSLAISLFLNITLLSNSELESAVDNLDVAAVEKIFSENIQPLCAAEVSKLSDRLAQNLKKHRTLYYGTTTIASVLLGTFIGYSVFKKFIRSHNIEEEIKTYEPAIGEAQMYRYMFRNTRHSWAEFLSVLSGLSTSVLGTAISIYFFPSDKYHKINNSLQAQLYKQEVNVPTEVKTT